MDFSTGAADLGQGGVGRNQGFDGTYDVLEKAKQLLNSGGGMFGKCLRSLGKLCLFCLPS